MEVEVGEDGKALGKYLRVRVRLDIRKPIMRGITIYLGEKMLLKLCPFEYEYLPDFCYTCGIIGHVDRACSIKLKRGEQQQYDGWLKAETPKRGPEIAPQRWSGGRGGGSSSYGGGERGRSDTESWRKKEQEAHNILGSGGDQSKKGGKVQEVSNPVKLPSTLVTAETQAAREGTQQELVCVGDGQKEGDQTTLGTEKAKEKSQCVATAQHGAGRPNMHADGVVCTSISTTMQTVGVSVEKDVPLVPDTKKIKGGRAYKKSKEERKHTGDGEGGRSRC